MRISIHLPSTSHSSYITLDKGVFDLNGLGEEEVDAVLGLIVKAAARRSITAAASPTNPLDRIAAAIEVFASKVPDENGRNSDSHYKQELNALKAKLLVREYFADLMATHSAAVEAFKLKGIEELARDMAWEYKQVKLGDALDAVVDALKAKAFDRAEKDTLDAIAKPSVSVASAEEILTAAKVAFNNFKAGDVVSDPHGSKGTIVDVGHGHASVKNEDGVCVRISLAALSHFYE